MTDLSPAARAAADVIRGFRWHNYGLDVVENTEADDWVNDLATAAANAIRDLEDRMDGEAIRRAEEADGDGLSFILHDINGSPAMIPEDGTQYDEWRVRHTHSPWVEEGLGQRAAIVMQQRMTALVSCHPDDYVRERRTVITWPDGHELTTPWELDEESADE